MAIKIGSKCPTFSLLNQNGEEVFIKDYIGKENLVIYFYPKDDTGGCTAQACEFRDFHDDFAQLQASVFGISSDSVDSHKKFATKNNLNFQLLADTEGKVRKLFESKSSLFGLISSRETFIVDKKGIVIGVFRDLVNATKHVEYAKNLLKTLG